MTTVFADTFYFLALLDSREDRHHQAFDVSRDPQLRILTTEWALAEFGDAYCHPKDRADFVALYRSLLNHPRVKIVPADTRLFQRGVEFFEQRQDKEWSLSRLASKSVSRHFGSMKLLERITVEPGKCGGRPCIRGMRIRVKDVLDMLADGAAQEEILADFPDLQPEDIQASIAYAARYLDHSVLVTT